MDANEGEIEYLDEDEDLVQQYVQNIPVSYRSKSEINPDPTPTSSLLTERQPEKKKKIEDDDSDYDPTEDLLALKPKPKRKILVKKPLKSFSAVSHSAKGCDKDVLVLKSSEDFSKIKELAGPIPTTVSVPERKKLDIELPNYQDPLCLSVKAVNNNENDFKKLRNWNGLCLELYRKTRDPLKPPKGETASSTRTCVLKNKSNDSSRKVDTSLFTKTTVRNSEGAVSTEASQIVLPFFKEKQPVNNYQLHRKYHKVVPQKNVIILTKENIKDEEYLVAYNATENVSAVYKFGEVDPDNEEPSKQLGIREVSCAKMCARCYQTSWRGVVQAKNDTMRCPICGRFNSSVYGALSHLKTHHTDQDVRKVKHKISKALAKIVDYHYKCRICQIKVNSIKTLRRHTKTHLGNNLFKCDVGNHLTK